MSEMIKSCGIVVVRLEDGEYKFLMLRAGKFWEAGPKGKPEPNETQFETAIRETQEETGLCEKDLNFHWDKINYTTESYKKNKKTVTYFIAHTNVTNITIPYNPEINKYEHDEWAWMTYNEALQLSNERIQKVLKWANELLTT